MPTLLTNRPAYLVKSPDGRRTLGARVEDTSESAPIIYLKPEDALHAAVRNNARVICDWLAVFTTTYLVFWIPAKDGKLTLYRQTDLIVTNDHGPTVTLLN